jgi:hypothetical protein
MTTASALRAIMSAAALLAAATGGAGAQAGPPPPPPPPRIVIRPPTISAPQQQSFWGINQNLERSRDRRQGAAGVDAKPPQISDDPAAKHEAQ